MDMVRTNMQNLVRLAVIESRRTVNRVAMIWLGSSGQIVQNVVNPVIRYLEMLFYDSHPLWVIARVTSGLLCFSSDSKSVCRSNAI